MVGERAHALLLLPVLGGVKTLSRLFPPRIARERLSPLLAVGLDLEQRVEDGVSGEPLLFNDPIHEAAHAVDGGGKVKRGAAHVRESPNPLFAPSNRFSFGRSWSRAIGRTARTETTGTIPSTGFGGWPLVSSRPARGASW